MSSVTTYEFDESAASKADDVASRIDQSAAYIGRFTDAHAIKAKSGTAGIHFEFKSPGGGLAGFDIYTRKEDGTATFGMNQLSAIMSILGLKGLTARPGKFEAWNNDTGKREETDGEVFVDLLDKDVGLVLQKEKYTGQDSKERSRMNLFGVFHPVSRLTASEIKERKQTPEKLEKMLRSLKDKDSRTAVAAEPAQPGAGAPSGGY